jgi:hypothetical protein
MWGGKNANVALTPAFLDNFGCKKWNENFKKLKACLGDFCFSNAAF